MSAKSKRPKLLRSLKETKFQVDGWSKSDSWVTNGVFPNITEARQCILEIKPWYAETRIIEETITTRRKVIV